MFEALCVTIKVTCSANPDAVDSFENVLFPPFQQILIEDVSGKCYVNIYVYCGLYIYSKNRTVHCCALLHLAYSAVYLSFFQTSVIF